MSFGLQFSLQKANENFHSAVLEHKSNAAKLGTVKSSNIFCFRMQFSLRVIDQAVLIGPSSQKDCLAFWFFVFH